MIAVTLTIQLLFMFHSLLRLAKKHFPYFILKANASEFLRRKKNRKDVSMVLHPLKEILQSFSLEDKYLVMYIYYISHY